ncbi:MAG TPA: coenzyme F420-0:L-glutamate ligase [Acidimicrobiia bacterium]|nr:coenzyme F420-0:L-glutamate ligase [Acidimicrobiia bacterium]
MAAVSIFPVEGIGEAQPGDDVATLIGDALAGGIVDRDVLVVTHKLISKAEGRIVELEDDGPDSHRWLVEQEAVRIVRRRGPLVIAQTRHGFICANAGVDRSNAGPGRAILLPEDPDRSANRIRLRLQHRFGVTIAVIVTDTFGRAWRRGLVDVAIGVAGMEPIDDLRGQTDTFGKVLEVSEVAVVDEIAAAADLVMGKAKGIPAAVVRGVPWKDSDVGIAPVIRPPHEDMFR